MKQGTLAKLERDLIIQTLIQFGNNKSHAARSLGVTIKTLYNKLAIYGIEDVYMAKYDKIFSEGEIIIKEKIVFKEIHTNKRNKIDITYVSNLMYENKKLKKEIEELKDCGGEKCSYDPCLC